MHQRVVEGYFRDQKVVGDRYWRVCHWGVEVYYATSEGSEYKLRVAGG